MLQTWFGFNQSLKTWVKVTPVLDFHHQYIQSEEAYSSVHEFMDSTSWQLIGQLYEIRIVCMVRNWWAVVVLS